MLPPYAEPDDSRHHQRGPSAPYRAVVVVVNAARRHLTAEYPFGHETSRLEVALDQTNPVLGPGLALKLRLPVDEPEERMARYAIWLNNREQESVTGCHLLGSWGLDTEQLPAITFACFLPSAVVTPRLTTNLTLGMVRRASWVCEALTGKSCSQLYQQVHARKLKELEFIDSQIGPRHRASPSPEPES